MEQRIVLIIGKFERPPGETLYFAVTAQGVTRSYAGEIGMLEALAEAGFAERMRLAIEIAETVSFWIDLKVMMPAGLLLLRGANSYVIYVSGKGLHRELFGTVEAALERAAELDPPVADAVTP